MWGIPGPPNLIPTSQFFPVVSRGHDLMHRLCTMNPQFASSVLVSSSITRFAFTKNFSTIGLALTRFSMA